MTVLFGSSACPVVVSASLSKKRRKKTNNNNIIPKRADGQWILLFLCGTSPPPSISRYCVVIDVCKAFNYFRLKRALTAAFFCGVGR